MQARELTGKEKRSIRRLIKEMCANYDSEYGCLMLDSQCYMFGKTYTGGALCKWFRNAVMPLESEIMRLFVTSSTLPDSKTCVVCGKGFPANGRQAYCSKACVAANRRKYIANKMREYRKRLPKIT